MKADVAVRRLARLEKEHSQLEDEEREEREASLPDALADRTKAEAFVDVPLVNLMDWTIKGVVTPVKNREQQPSRSTLCHRVRLKDCTQALGSNGVGKGWSYGNALVGEFMMTFLLIFTVLQTAVNSEFDYSSMACFAIGFCFRTNCRTGIILITASLSSNTYNKAS